MHRILVRNVNSHYLFEEMEDSYAHTMEREKHFLDFLETSDHKVNLCNWVLQDWRTNILLNV